jgi:hypothetical protein
LLVLQNVCLNTEEKSVTTVLRKLLNGRKIARNLRDVTAEVLAFKGAYDSYLTALAPGVTGGSREEAKARLQELISGGNQ